MLSGHINKNFVGLLVCLRKRIRHKTLGNSKNDATPDHGCELVASALKKYSQA